MRSLPLLARPGGPHPPTFIECYNTVITSDDRQTDSITVVITELVTCTVSWKGGVFRSETGGDGTEFWSTWVVDQEENKIITSTVVVLLGWRTRCSCRHHSNASWRRWLRALMGIVKHVTPLRSTHKRLGPQGMDGCELGGFTRAVRYYRLTCSQQQQQRAPLDRICDSCTQLSVRDAWKGLQNVDPSDEDCVKEEDSLDHLCEETKWRTIVSHEVHPVSERTLWGKNEWSHDTTFTTLNNIVPIVTIQNRGFQTWPFWKTK